jgi:hypothetical protein
MNKEIFIKYLNNTCSEDELSAFLIWLDSDFSDEILLDVCKSEWVALFENSEEPGFERSDLILDKIHHTINTCNNNNVDFNSEDENLKSWTDSDTFNDESLNHILDLIKRSTLIDYKILCRINKTTGLSQSNKL